MSKSPHARPAAGRRFLAWLAGAMAVLSVGAAFGLRAGEAMARARIAAIGERLGLIITVGDIDIPWVGGMALREVSVDADVPEGRVRLAHLARVETDLDLLAVAGGARRPGAVRVHGGSIHVRVGDDGVVGAPIRRTRDEDGAGDDGGGGAISIALEGVTVRVDARFEAPTLLDAVRSVTSRLSHGVPPETAEAAVVLAPVVVTGVQASLTRGADGVLAVQGEGTLEDPGGEGPVAVEIAASSRGVLTLRTKHEDGLPMRARLDTPQGPLHAALRGVSIEDGAGRAAGVMVAGGEAALAIDAVEANLTSSSGEIDGGEVVARGVSARRGEVAVRVNEAALGVARGGAGARWPEPKALTLREVLAVSKPGGEGGGAARFAVRRIVATFDGIVAGALAGDVLAGVASVVVDGPEGVLTIPDAIVARAAESAPEEDRAPVGEDGMPLMPNDDAAMLGDRQGTPAVARAGGFGALDRLFTALEPGLERLDALTRGRIGAMARTAARLKPEVRGAVLALRDEAGAELFVLDEGAFSLGPSEKGGLAVKFESRLVRSGAEAGRFSARGEVDADGRLGGAELRIRGKEVAGRLAALVDHFDVQRESEVDLSVTWTRPAAEGSPHHIKGRFQFKHFTFSYWRISDRPIDELEGVVDFDVSLDTAGRRLLVDLPTVRVRDGRVAASVDIRKPANARPSFRFRLRMPRQDCGAAAASIPKSLIPNLSTLRLRGTAQFDAALDVDLEKPRELTLRVEGDLDACEVLSLSPEIDPERLRGRFVHHPREPERGVLTHIAVGRGTREWIPSEEIPEIVKLAAWVTEDRKWEDHGGVRWDLVASALKIDLDHGRFVYGGSTITQQLVKNLYLTRTKNLARKFEEAIIAWQMERVLEKDEILTAYINCIEYGPDVYGIRAAAEHYFDKTPQELDALEAAFIMGLKPYPKAGQRQFERGTLDKWWIRRVSYVLRLMAKYGPEHITLEEAEAFAPFQPAFRRP